MICFSEQQWNIVFKCRCQLQVRNHTVSGQMSPVNMSELCQCTCQSVCQNTLQYLCQSIYRTVSQYIYQSICLGKDQFACQHIFQSFYAGGPSWTGNFFSCVVSLFFFVRIQEQQPDFRKKEGQGKKRVEVESGGKKGKNTKRHEDHERKRELLRHCCSLRQQQQVFFPWAAAAITSTVVPRQQLPPPPPQLQDQDLAKTEGTKSGTYESHKNNP